MTGMPPKAELRTRLQHFREALHARKLPAALITNERNVRYLSGFSGGDSALLVTAEHKVLLTDFRYLEEARKTVPSWEVVIEKVRRGADGKPEVLIPHGLMEKAGHMMRKLRLRKLGFEAGDMRVADLRNLRKAARGVRLKPQNGLVGELRLCKSPWEVRQIEKALRIQERAFEELCRSLEDGIREREAAAWLRYLMVKGGADDQAFESMFQVGSHSSLPHGRPTGRRFRGSAVILVDWGSKFAGYHSDLTRTFFLGTISPRLRKIHQTVLEAQRQAIARVEPGVALAEVDAAAREVISKAGYGKAFGHSTGHGLGLDIHEAPSLSARSKGVLRPGMVVTVEPGVYLPGLGGVRIEDDVLVTPNGHRVLSRLRAGLRWNGEDK
ncbi:MAG: Xaa-Pro peptidase family protein [Planctomycetota bacterium]|nr:Xaa-Pro peptidase family protein [Planctomycetota bacterium]